MKTLKIGVIGFLAGIICGLFSSGGGLILVPAFINILGMDDKKARGTTVTCILPLVIVSSIYYYKNNYFNYKIGIECAIGGGVGALIGAKLLNKIPTLYLRLLFALFLIFTSIKMLFFSC